MPTTRMTIKYVNEPKEGKSRGSIKATDDTFLGCPQALLKLFEKGKTYDVTYSESGEWKTVTGATEVETERPRLAASNPSPTSQTKYETCAKDAERMYVCSLVNAFIQAGKIEPTAEHVTKATNAMRVAWQRTFGGQDGTFQASEAGRVARG